MEGQARGWESRALSFGLVFCSPRELSGREGLTAGTEAQRRPLFSRG